MKHLAWLAIALLAAACNQPPAPTPLEPTPLAADEPTAMPVRPLSLALEPQPVPQGGRVRITGRGFAAGEAVVLSAAATSSLGEATASPSGTIEEVDVQLPESLESGPHAIQAVGQTSGRRSSGTLWVRAREPWLVLSTHSVQPYAELGCIMGGFDPQSFVRIALQPKNEGASLDLIELPTDQAGNTEWTSPKLPGMRPGQYILVLRGASGELRREIEVAPLKPNVELSPWAGPAGAPVQINGRGFGPNERVSVTWGNLSTPAGELQADQDGNLWGAGPIRAPQSALAGPLAMVLVGAESGAKASPAYQVLETKPWLELTTWWGAPGVPVGFSGGGWVGGENITFRIGAAGGPVVGAGQADDWGWIRSSDLVYVPLESEMDVTFVAVGDLSHATAEAVYKVVFPFDLRPRRAP